MGPSFDGAPALSPQFLYFPANPLLIHTGEVSEIPPHHPALEFFDPALRHRLPKEVHKLLVHELELLPVHVADVVALAQSLLVDNLLDQQTQDLDLFRQFLPNGLILYCRAQTK